MTFALALITQLLLILLVVTAAGLGTAVGYFYLRAKRQEDAGLTTLEKAELKQRDQELSAIRLRIEEIYERQQIGADTQQAIIQQQFEQLNNELRTRSRQIEGLQGQLRSEIEARRSEMDQLRAQLEEAVQHVMRTQLEAPRFEEKARPIAALPAAPDQPIRDASESDQILRPPAKTPLDEASEASGGAGPPRMPLLYDDFDDDHFPIELVDEEDRDSIDFSWEPVDLDLSDEQETYRPYRPNNDLVSLFDDPEDEPITDDASQLAGHEDPPQMATDEEVLEVDDSIFFDAASTEDCPSPVTEEVERPEFDPLDDSFTVEFASSSPAGEPIMPEPYFSSGDGQSAQADEPARSTPAPPEPPAGADDLTVIPMIDEDRQRLLYQLGVLTLTDVAHLNRSDADRIASAIRGVSGEEVATDWVFAAQSVLFARYQAEMSRPRSQAA